MEVVVVVVAAKIRLVVIVVVICVAVAITMVTLLRGIQYCYLHQNSVRIYIECTET